MEVRQEIRVQTRKRFGRGRPASQFIAAGRPRRFVANSVPALHQFTRNVRIPPRPALRSPCSPFLSNSLPASTAASALAPRPRPRRAAGCRAGPGGGRARLLAPRGARSSCAWRRRGADPAAPPARRSRAYAGHRARGRSPAGTWSSSVRCGSRRVSYLPLARSRSAPGSSVRAGTPARQPGCGARRSAPRRPANATRSATRSAARCLRAARRPVARRAAAAGRPSIPPRTAPPPALAGPASGSSPTRRSPLAAPPLAAKPPAAWAGLALVLTGDRVGHRDRVRRRRLPQRAVASRRRRQPPRRSTARRAPAASGARHALLRHDAHLLRERGAAPGPCVHHDRRRHPRAPPPPAR